MLHPCDQVYALELDPYLRDFAAPHFKSSGFGDRIEVLVGSASDSLRKLAARGINFDLAFVDADKTGYLGYYKQLMDNQLIVPGGSIVIDNALMKVCSKPMTFFINQVGLHISHCVMTSCCC